MIRNQWPQSLSEKFVAVCISLLVGALALNWAVRLICQIWPQLLIGLSVIVLVIVAIGVYRWRRNRW